MGNHMAMFKRANPWKADALLMSQNKLISKLPPGDASRRGVCRSLCMAHCALRKAGSSIGKAMGRESATSAEDREKFEGAMIQWASKLQENVITPTSSMSEKDAWIAQGQSDTKQLAGLQILQSECKELAWQCTDEIAQLTTTLANAAKYYIVILPLHVVCTYMHGEKACVFDPNFGETRVARENFASLLSTFLTHPRLREAYGLTPGAAIFLTVFW